MHYSEIIFFGCFIAFIVGILLVDLLVIDKEAHEVSMKEAGIDVDIEENGLVIKILCEIFNFYHIQNLRKIGSRVKKVIGLEKCLRTG